MLNRKILAPLVVAVSVMALAPSVLWGASSVISGTVGQTLDAGATTGFYLRYVGDPAPAGYSHGYQWGEPAILTESPEDTPVVFSGTLNVADRVPTSVAGIGLLDPDGLAAGTNGFFSGAHIYVNTLANGDLRIGVADGSVGGEIVQHFIIVPSVEVPDLLSITFTIDGSADPSTCGDAADVATADGCMTLQIDELDATITDSYGTIISGGNAVEFTNGGVPGWEAFIDGSGEENTGIEYALTIEPTVANDPTSIADCQDGGFEQYGFSNQGLCIRFVNTGVDTRD